jgi:hypothetical protein
LADAFYSSAFSFADFLKQYPHHRRNLTDLLIGRAFTPEAARLVEDLDHAVQASQAGSPAYGSGS